MYLWFEDTLTYCGQRKRGPVKAVDVLSGQTRVVGPVVVVYPTVRPKPNDKAHGKVNARVPMDEDEDAEHHLADAEHIGVSCSSLGSVEKFEHARYAKKSEGKRNS